MCHFAAKTSKFVKSYRNYYTLLDKSKFVSYHLQRRLCSSDDFKSDNGKKKDVSGPFPTSYNPREVESQWYDWWLDQGLFKPSLNDAKKTFTMVLPPPNVTGDLHIGHAFAVTIEDALIRWHRSRGFNCIYVPGYDHAGIATQVVVEKKLKAEIGVDRHSMGKVQFQSEVRRWSDVRIANIRKQLERLGSSLDWSRETFTMSESYKRAVTEAFVRLHNDGLITRRRGLVNWCCQLQSTISDIEVDHVVVSGSKTYKDPSYDVPIRGTMTEFAYPLEGSRDKVVVATTRVETIFGDVAIAVNPDDRRYGHLKGKNVVHPFDGRVLPIVFDDSVDQSIGTGCLKVTPGHSHEDFRLAEGHGLSLVNILNETGHLVTQVTKFDGLHRFAAREAVIEELKKLGLFRRQRDYEVTLPICSRSGGIVEPLLKSQWFLDTSELTRGIADDLASGTLSVNPEHSRKDLSHWLEISKDSKWCLSRQLYWGHQIPAYRVKNCDPEDETWIVARHSDDALRIAAQKFDTSVELVRDEDVLDTWFSSALFPFVAFGWPDDTDSFRMYYPLSLMETGRDILFFWVVRMLMLGKQLTGTLPFANVLAHGLVCDAIGRKMSKSLGNVVDPSHVIDGISLEELLSHRRDGHMSSEAKELERTRAGLKKSFPNGIPQCGADALRFALCSQDIKDQTASIDIRYVNSCRTFCNKVWQACRFYLMSKEKANRSDPLLLLPALAEVRRRLTPIDRWILSQLYNMVAECEVHFEAYDLHLVTKAIKNFWHLQFCDVYIEAVKPIFNNDSPSSIQADATLSVMRKCIETGVVAMSPFMPFLAEELYQRLKLSSREESVCLAPYPCPRQWERWHDSHLDANFKKVLEIVHELRRFKRLFDISGSTMLQVFLTTDVIDGQFRWEDVVNVLNTLGRCQVHLNDTMPPSRKGLLQLQSSTKLDLTVQLIGVVDVAKSIDEFERQRKELNRRVSATNSLRVCGSQESDKVEGFKEKLKEIENYLLHLKHVLANERSME